MLRDIDPVSRLTPLKPRNPRRLAETVQSQTVDSENIDSDSETENPVIEVPESSYIQPSELSNNWYDRFNPF